MAYITGEWTAGIGKKVWKNVRLSINKYTKQAAEDIINRAGYDLERWEADVLDVISDPLARNWWHKKRDPTRMWPHLNTGKQAGSISSGVKMHVTGQGNYAITSWAQIDVDYAEFTNQGYRPRADGEVPRWIGWLDDVFYGTRGFFSVSDVFKRLVSERGGVI